MKIKSLQLTNFANYEKVSVSFDPNVNYLIGPNGAGKTTLGLTGIHFLFQGIAEKASGGNKPLIGERFRFIGPNSPIAKGEMILHDEKKNIDIKVKRKLTKTGTELSFEAPEGIHLSQQWLTDLFNIFLIAPKKFIELSGKDQAKAIGIDTLPYDTEIAILKQEFTMINRDLKNIGEIDEVDKAERINLDDLQLQKAAIRNKINVEYRENKTANEATRKLWMEDCEKIRTEINYFNRAQDETSETIKQFQGYRARFISIAAELEGLRELIDLSKLDDFISNLPKPEDKKEVAMELPDEPQYIPEMPDDSELKAIDEKINSAVEINTQANEYDSYLKKIKLKEDKQMEAENNKGKQYKKTNERLAYIQSFELPFDGLEVSDDGDLLLNGKPLTEPYFSTGELIKIVPQLLAVQNPEFRYVYIQDGSLLDKANLKEIEDYLTRLNFQLVIEYVSEEKITGKNCILLKNNIVQ